MPRYFFHLDNAAELDAEGVELPNAAAAQREAARRVGVALCAEPGALWTDDQCGVRVTDALGLVLLRVDVIATLSAAVGPQAGLASGRS